MDSAFVPNWDGYSSYLVELAGVLADEKITKCAHNGFSFDRQVTLNHGLDVQGLVDTLRMSKMLRSDKLWGHGLKDHMTKTLGYKNINSFVDLFTKPKILEKKVQEFRTSWKKIDGRRVPVIYGGEVWRFGSAREYIPLDIFIAEFPERIPAMIDYAVLDAVAALELYEVLQPQLDKIAARTGSLWDFYAGPWTESLYALNEIERAGVLWDSERSKDITARLVEDRNQALQAVRSWTDINLDSPKQVAEFIYETQGQPIPPVCGSSSALHAPKADKRPTDFGALCWHRDNSDYPRLYDSMLKYKETTKLLQYLTKMDESSTGPDGRIHCVLSPDTDTGRLSSRNPNLQQIPARDEYGFRKCFISAPGHSMVVCDYSQLELVVLAHILQKTFQNSSLAADILLGDIHNAVADRCWPGREYILKDDKLVHPMRHAAKSVIYGLNYGKGPKSLGLQLNMSWKEAADIIKVIKEEYGIAEFHEWQQRRAEKLGYVQTILGRRRPLPHARLFPDTDEKKKLKAAAMRQALNSPIQGTAADIVTLAMSKVARDARLRKLGAKLILQIHDELILEVPDENATAAKEILVECMEHPQEGLLSVPLRVSANIGKNWSEAK